MLSTDRLDLLQLFMKIAESESISDSANMIGISQPSASRLLKRLESLLDTQLFQRIGSGVRLTSSGAEFLPVARDLLRRWDLAAHASKTPQRKLTGHIRIAASVAIGETVLSALAARFMRKHPGLTLDLDLRDDQVDLANTEYDLWIRAGKIKSDQLVVREITRGNRGVFCSMTLGAVAHPSKLQAFRAIRLTPYVPESLRLTSAQGETFVLRQSCVMTTNNLYAAYSATIEGIGYAVLPLWLTQPDLERGTLIQACPAWAPEPVVLSLAYLPGRNRPARIGAITKYLLHELKGLQTVRSIFSGGAKAFEQEPISGGIKPPHSQFAQTY